VRVQTNRGLKHYHFKTFPKDAVYQAVYTRHGGVSPFPWNSLNLGSTVGDQLSNVVKNKHRLLEQAGLNEEQLHEVWQIHSDRILIAERPRTPDRPLRKADAVLTDQPGVGLLMRFADCVPIFLYDPEQKAIGLVHAGWKGTALKVAAKAVQAMQRAFGSDPNRILAGLGPSIGPDHYQVGQEVIQAIKSAFPDCHGKLLKTQHGAVQLDLWQANKTALEQAGVKGIEISGVCTACNVEDWYSHRAEQGKTGRFGAVFYLKRGS